MYGTTRRDHKVHNCRMQTTWLVWLVADHLSVDPMVTSSLLEAELYRRPEDTNQSGGGSDVLWAKAAS